MARAKRVRVIVNPSAHSGKARRLPGRSCLPGLPPDGPRLEWVESRSAEDLRDLVRAAQEEELDALALAGGDGTVAMALNALDGLNRVPIGLLPAGSGNDLARDLGIPRALPEALAVVSRGRTRRIDVGRVHPSEQRFGCAASAGLDELALRIVHRSGWPRSRALNIYAALRALAAYRPQAVRICWEGGTFEGEVMFVAVTNTRGYAGGFLVNPGARLDDGLLNLCIVRRTGRARLLRHFPRVFRGTHGTLPEVILDTSPWVRIEGVDESLPVALDGELPQMTTPVDLQCEPGMLQVLVPGTIGAGAAEDGSGQGANTHEPAAGRV